MIVKMYLVLTFLFSLYPKSKCHDPRSFSCSLCFQRQSSPLLVMWEHLKGRLRRSVWGTQGQPVIPSVIPLLRGEPTVERLQEDCSRILCVCGGYTEYGQPVLPLPFTVSWVVCFRAKLRKEFQACNQINPSIAENCLSCKHLPWACKHLPWAEKSTISHPEFCLLQWQQRELFSLKEAWPDGARSYLWQKGRKLEENLPDEAIPWSFYSSLSSSK